MRIILLLPATILTIAAHFGAYRAVTLEILEKTILDYLSFGFVVSLWFLISGIGVVVFFDD